MFHVQNCTNKKLTKNYIFFYFFRENYKIVIFLQILFFQLINSNISVRENIGFVMAGSINKVILVGNLGRDPEVRSTQDGAKIVSLSLATTEMWKDKATGERKDRTEWHRVVVFNPALADVCEKYLHKGSRIYLEGQLQTRKWQDQSGADRFTTEVVIPRFRGELVLLDTKGGSDADVSAAPIDAAAAPIDDDIPF